jgi:hypothetical protein
MVLNLPAPSKRLIEEIPVGCEQPQMMRRPFCAAWIKRRAYIPSSNF